VLRNMSSLDQTQAISEGRLHVGFVALPIDDAGLATETVMHRPIWVALPADHPLAKLERVPLQALSGEPQIMFARSNGPRFFDAVLAACREAGFSMNIAHEVDNLYTAKALVAAGLGVVLITHKLREVMAIADRVTVLRRGEVVLTGASRDFAPEQLGRAMIGESAGEEALRLALEAVPAAPASGARRVGAILEIRGLTVAGPAGVPPRVRDVSLDVQPHEIVGIVAVEGNGQRELMRAVAGLQPYQGQITTATTGGVGFVPEDRQLEGLILDFTITDNLALGARHGFWMDRAYMEHEAALAIEEYAIRIPGADRPVRTLSGGNQQRVVLSRELGRRPALLVAENPTRGLDVGATADVHARLRAAARNQGLGVLFYSTDLDEVLALADRIGVMVNGTWRWVSEAERTREQVGALMLGGAA